MTSESQFQEWLPKSEFAEMPSANIAFSRGFLQLRLDSWLPTIKSHWQHFFDGLGCEVKIIEVTPQLEKKPEAEARPYALDIDGELALLHVSEALLHLSLETLWPASRKAGRNSLLQYLMLRVAGSVNNSWAGAEKMSVKALQGEAVSEEKSFAFLKVVFSVNALKTEVYFGLSRVLVERLDKVWRRQVQGMTRESIVSGTVSLALPELTVARQELESYLTAGTIIDLEVPTSTSVDLLLNDRRWGTGNLAIVDSTYCLEITGTQSLAPIENSKLKKDTVRFQLGTFLVEPQLAAELLQPKAWWNTNIPASNRLTITVNNKPVGNAVLGSYQGRFAARVV